MRTKELHQYLLGMSQLCYYYINPRLNKLSLRSRKERNWTFDSKRLLSLQLNPSYQQTEPSFCIYNIYIYSLLFTLISPVQFPLHEPYFDLTPIEVTHTKMNWTNEKELIILIKKE
jgi:hypothetical protein